MIALEIKKLLEPKYAARRNATLKRGNKAPDPRLCNIAQTGDHSDSTDEAAADSGVSRRYVADAQKIAETSPETAEAVKRGEKTIPQAKQELGLDKPKGSNDKPKPRPVKEAPAPGPETIIQDDPGQPSATVEDFAEARDEQAALHQRQNIFARTPLECPATH